MIEKCFDELENKYGDDFCWLKVSDHLMSDDNNSFVSEAYREIAQDHPLYGVKLTTLAKSEVNDDVLSLVHIR